MIDNLISRFKYRRLWHCDTLFRHLDLVLGILLSLLKVITTGQIFPLLIHHIDVRWILILDHHPLLLLLLLGMSLHELWQGLKYLIWARCLILDLDCFHGRQRVAWRLAEISPYCILCHYALAIDVLDLGLKSENSLLKVKPCNLHLYFLMSWAILVFREHLLVQRAQLLLNSPLNDFIRFQSLLHFFKLLSLLNLLIEHLKLCQHYWFDVLEWL